MPIIHKAAAVVGWTIVIAMSTSVAEAARVLSRDEVKTLVAGKTAHAKHEARGYEFKTYFGSDGKAATLRNGNTTEGTWRVQIDGFHCVNFGDGENCATIEDNGDGTYARVTAKGKRTVTWRKFVDGKDF